MSRASTMFRLATLGLVGGCLFQVVGCVSGIIPVLFSVGESVILSGLVNQLVP